MRKIVFFLTILLLYSFSAIAQTTITGDISRQIFKPSGNPFVVIYIGMHLVGVSSIFETNNSNTTEYAIASLPTRGEWEQETAIYSSSPSPFTNGEGVRGGH